MVSWEISHLFFIGFFWRPVECRRIHKQWGRSRWGIVYWQTVMSCEPLFQHISFESFCSTNNFPWTLPPGDFWPDNITCISNTLLYKSFLFKKMHQSADYFLNIVQKETWKCDMLAIASLEEVAGTLNTFIWSVDEYLYPSYKVSTHFVALCSLAMINVFYLGTGFRFVSSSGQYKQLPECGRDSGRAGDVRSQHNQQCWKISQHYPFPRRTTKSICGPTK